MEYNNTLPRHIAIIMDGNGRWAKKRGLPRKMGHAAGAETFRRIATYCKNLGVEYLTVYAFSTENWKRSADEVQAIMALFEKYLHEAIDEMERDHIRLKILGELGPISPELRGPTTVAVVIGLTSWTWTARSVRSQVISLRNRDHVNLSKLSGHSLIRIVVTDILPYIASYVVMAFILQVSSGILSEAQLSLLGLGPKTTVTPTLGLMMNWAMSYSAHINGTWWAYLPVILTITLISFSLNLMNTGLDQVFNPTLRD